jgi:hypothetical protein
MRAATTCGVPFHYEEGETMKRMLFYLAAILLLTGTACGAGQTPTAAATQPPLATQLPLTDTEAPAQPPASTEPPLSGLPAEPQQVEFQAEDGTALVGYYYPSRYTNAPVIVLMHWARGDQRDWSKVGLVQWLQNRQEGRAGLSSRAPQTSIYPPMPPGLSFAVFTFDYRGFGESGDSAGFDSQGWLMDSKAAYATAATLPGVDPQRIAGIGSSIGADGVVDGCDGCLGALSLSPSGYLGVAYAERVTVIDLDGGPVWCIASENDSEAAPTCRGASGEHYQTFIYPGDAHGTVFLLAPDPSLDPPIGQVILDWTLLTFDIQT